MAAGIFISYRHDDTRHVAGRLAGDLAARFGADRIFRDIERIEPGVDFTEALNKALESCVLMLVIIGDRWLTITDAKGQRRLDDPQDWTRLEVVTALKRGIRVVPVLVEGAARPDITDLPEDLHPLVRRQTVNLADNRWKGDLQALVETLERMPGLERAAARPHESAASAPPPSPSPAPSAPPRPPFAPMPAAALAKAGRGRLLIGAGLGVVALLVAAAFVDPNDNVEAEAEPQRAVGLPAAPEPSPSPAPALARTITPAPPPVQAPAQTVLSNPAPAPVVPNLAGMWRTITGESYQFTQNGAQVQITAFFEGQSVGTGAGEIEGPLLRLSMSMRVQGTPLGNLNCNMQATPDFRGFTGICAGPNGQFPAQLFR